MPADLPRLLQAVQRNCDIADARHARDMTLCDYLLEMREYYRWERGLPLDAVPDRAELAQWLAQREAAWSDLEGADFAPLPLEGQWHEPFRIEAINQALAPRGLAYGAGYGRAQKPHFFLGERIEEATRDGVRLIVVGREYARDLSAAPAALQAGTIWLRRDALARWLWEKVEIWGVKKSDGPLASALRLYGLDAHDPRAALERMAERESETLILHELGEAQAESVFGPAWPEMLMSLRGRRAELLARAVRDHLADCVSTLPTLIERGAAASIHFWFANLEGVRRSLFPRLLTAYDAWCAGDEAPLAEALAAGRDHWAEAGRGLVELRAQYAEDFERRMEALIPDGPSPLAL